MHPDKNDGNVDKYPNYKNELLSQIENKKAAQENSKMIERQYAIDQNMKSKKLLEDVNYEYKKGSTKAIGLC